MSRHDDHILIIDEDVERAALRQPRQNGKPAKRAAGGRGDAKTKRSSRYIPKGNGPQDKGNKGSENVEREVRRGHPKKTKVLGHKASLRGLPVQRKGSAHNKRSNAQERNDNGQGRKEGGQGEKGIGQRRNDNGQKRRDNGQGRIEKGQRKPHNPQRDNRQGNCKHGPAKSGQGKRGNHHPRKGNQPARGKRGHAKKTAMKKGYSSSELGLIGEGMQRNGKKMHDSTEWEALSPCNIPWWCGFLITIMVIVLLTVAVGIVFLVNGEMKPKQEIIHGEPICKDTFKLLPNQYHQESFLEEGVNTVEECQKVCLQEPRVRCAAINFNKDGPLHNRCYILPISSLEYAQGRYTGVDEYVRIMCDSIEVAYVSDKDAGKSSTTRSTTEQVSTETTTTGEMETDPKIDCEAVYDMTPDRFGVGAEFQKAAHTMEDCLDVCTADPYCPALEYDTVLRTCYIHRGAFNGKLFQAAGVNHYDREPCKKKTPAPRRRTTPSEVHRTTSGPTLRTTTVPVRTTTRPYVSRPRRPVTSAPGAGRRTKASVPTSTSTSTTASTTKTTRSSTTASTTTTTTTTTSATTSTTTPTTTIGTTTTTSTTPTSESSSTSTSTESTTTVSANYTRPPPVNEHCEEDLTLIIDTSGPSDGPNSKNFHNTINLVKNIINNMRIGPSEARVSGIIFSTLAFTTFNFKDHKTKAEVLRAVDKLTFVGGLSNLPRAMRLWYDRHWPRSQALNRTSNVLLFSDVSVSDAYKNAFTHEAARWRTLTIQGEMRSIVVSTPEVHTVNLDRFTPLHTFTVEDYKDQAKTIYDVISLLPCRDYRPMPFARTGPSVSGLPGASTGL